jgi:peptide/nickel transport system ATP-binding protein
MAEAGAVDGHPDYLISVEDLRVKFHTMLGTVQALDGVTFSIPRGKVVGVVGESGCGKSVTGQAILQIVPAPGVIESGRILFRQRKNATPVDILKHNRHSAEMRNIRGNQISMIFQEPMTSLNPCYTIGNQILEAIRSHAFSQGDTREHTLEILRKVEMPNPEHVIDAYPHQLSGGMRQRAMIAMALACKPLLLIADEPTTALDVTTEMQILNLMRQLQSEIGMSILFITHNMGVVAQMCDDVVVMYLGKVVEQASVEDIFYNPKHPYTIALLRSIPRFGSRQHGNLESIRGSVPDPYTRIFGCAFHPRCPAFIGDVCAQVSPEMYSISEENHHFARCHLYS